VENLPQTETGKARDKAAEKVNADVSGRTLEKGKTVKDKAESDDEPEEVRECVEDIPTAWPRTRRPRLRRTSAFRGR